MISAQSFNIEWQGCFGGSDWDTSRDILMLDDGYFIIGSTRSYDGDVSYNHGPADGWLIKLSNTGELLWDKSYGGSSGESIYRIFPAGQDNYYLIGVSGSSDGDISNDPYPDSGDLWLLKIDAEGNIIWEEIYGGNGWEQIPTGVTTSDGGLVALVWSSSSDGDISMHYGLWDAWMIKVNSEGEKQWDFTLGSPGQDVGQAIIQTSDGGFLVGISSILFEGGNITCTPHNTDNSVAVLVKLDANLNIEWDRCYGGSNSDIVTSLVELTDGFLIGASSMSNDGNVSGNHGDSDIWIIKVDFDGNILWQKCYGGYKFDDLRNIHLLDNEEVVITSASSSNSGDVTGNHSISEYDHDIWVLKINNEGDLLWQHCFGGIMDEKLWFGFHYKSENNFVIAGQTDYGPSFDVGCTPHGGNGVDRDFWVFEVKDTTVYVNEVPAIEALKVYPNPAKDYVCFEYTNHLAHQGLCLELINTNGILIESIFFYPSETLKVWDTRGISPGIYFYRFKSGGVVLERGKVILQ
jgi:hypothetical protein